MSDKPLVQQALAQTLADLALDVRPKSRTRNGRVERTRAALCYLRGFWNAIVSEWGGMDRHRCDALSLSLSLSTPSNARMALTSEHAGSISSSC